MLGQATANDNHGQDARRLPCNVPDEQIADSPVQPPEQKYSSSLLTQITSTSIAIPPSQEGRIAIVTDVGRGMRWT